MNITFNPVFNIIGNQTTINYVGNKNLFLNSRVLANVTLNGLSFL
ncbi:MAG: hypothetical protein NZ908_01005 [Candidatus Micrarchaeota archaeon]|nr:hypothetical protein [Candidatus Micrarchaeota archaeon]MCX8154788.1 hypothetical protein [Candidatus Micrarchaeota archaeon]